MKAVSYDLQERSHPLTSNNLVNKRYQSTIQGTVAIAETGNDFHIQLPHHHAPHVDPVYMMQDAKHVRVLVSYQIYSLQTTFSTIHASHRLTFRNSRG